MAAGSFLTRLPTHERRLENGLTVLVREDRSAPVAAIVTHVKAGYFDEPDRLVGISHVLEHMYFKGTERRGVGSLARETKAAGGYLNAGTIYDYTSYYTVLPASSLALGLDIQSDALRNSKIDEAELQRELQVIIQEAKRKLDNPPAVAMESLFEEMFDVHPMRRWRIGTEEVLSRLTREDVLAYYRNLYRPGNIILVVAGAVDADDVFELVERYYGDMPGGEPVRASPPTEPERRELRFREQTGDILQAYLEWGWRTPGTLHPDTPVLDLLATVLGQGRASRLYQGVREAGRASSISAYNYTPTDIGVFGVSAELQPGDLADAVRAIWRHVRGAMVAPAHAGELARAKNLLEARMIRRHETVEGQARLLADWQALGDWRLAVQYMDRIMAASSDDVRRVAAGYLELDRATVLVYRPGRTASPGWDAAGLEESLRSEGAAPARPGAAPPPRPRPAPAGRRADHVEDGVHFFSLPGGVRVVVKPRHATPLVTMSMVTAGGASHEAPDRAGYTGLMARVAVKGTRNRTSERLAQETEALGGVLAPIVGTDLFGWSLGIPARHFEHGFALLADAALRPVFPEAELERERGIALNELEQLRDDMFRFPLHLFLQGAFRDHPYGYSMADTEAALRDVTRERLLDWHVRRFLAVPVWVLVVGDVDPARAAASIAPELDGLHAAEPPPPPPTPRWVDGPREEAVHRAKAQTAMALGFPGPERNHPDALTMRLLATLSSGLGGRLFDELRERRSLAYNVTAMAIARRWAGAFVAYIATSPEREDEARHCLLEQIERFASENVGRDELERAQQYMIGAWKIRSQTNGAQIADLAAALLLGHGLEELRTFEARVRAVTPVRLRDAVERYLDANRLVEGVVRGTGQGQ